MKQGLIVAFLLIAWCGKGQTEPAAKAQDTMGNFISSNLSVIWQKKFEDSCSFQQLVNQVKRSNTLINIDTFDNTITGQSVESFLDYRGAGYTLMGTPSYLVSSSFKSSVLIEYAKTGYTVKVTKMVFINQNDTKLISPTLGSAQGETTPLEQIAIKRTGEFKSAFSKPSAKIIDYSLEKLYNFKAND